MEQNFFEKILSIFNNQQGINKSNKISKKQIIESSKKSELFHSECKFTKKKICYCNHYKSKNDQLEKNLSNFLIDLVNDKVEITSNLYNKKLEIKKKHDLALTKREIELERIKHLSYKNVKNYLKVHDENCLSLNEYQEIEKNINQDKKVCENCKINIYENCYHKGWKNENGEYVLLCPLCSKKYFNGALEIKFESNNRKNEEFTNNNNSNNPNTNNTSNNPNFNHNNTSNNINSNVNRHSFNNIVRLGNNIEGGNIINNNVFETKDGNVSSKDINKIF